MKATKEQLKTYSKHYKNGLFKCPSCDSEWVGAPEIENEGERETQVYCLYGCGYIFLP